MAVRRDIAGAVNRRQQRGRPELNTRSVLVRILVGKAEMRQGFLRVRLL
jgi:hypothetical protein